ncbi:hypothetical protein C0585_06745 [Candidatus Woesearchaeota archaeon]|nr:MAG: hypothetical protein C0585_06745 [Candidatus Woesearchaeota archaeon]
MKRKTMSILMVLALMTMLVASVSAHHLNPMYDPETWPGNEERVHSGEGTEFEPEYGADSLVDYSGYPDETGSRINNTIRNSMDE